MGFPTETTPATQEDIRLLNNRIANNETIIAEINKWRMAHAGIDYTAAGADYPHPSQRVKTLTFGRETGLGGSHGRLSEIGVLLASSLPVGWLYNMDLPDPFSTANSWTKLVAAADSTSSGFEIKTNFDADDNATITLSSNPTSAIATATMQVVRGGNGSSIDLTLASTTLPGKFTVANAYTSQFGGLNADPAAATTEGDSWFRSDTSVQRIRAGGVNQNVSMDGDWSTKTIAAGVLTITTSRHKVDTQGGAATDDLDTVTGLNDGGFLVLTGVSAARVVTAKDGTGNLKLAGGDFVFTNITDTLMLVKQGSNFLEISRSTNA